MKILVAGGTGHTGERLVRRLLRAGHAVTVLSRRSDDPVLRGVLAAGATHAPGDCTRRWTLWEALEGKDALIGCAHVRYAEACVQACQRVGVRRYLQMSSTRRFTRYPCVSSREVIEGEAAITNSDLDFTILRATMIFGGRRDANLTKLVAWFRRRRWMPFFGDDQNLVQPVFVEDLLDAFMAALERPQSQRKAYTLAGPEPITQERMMLETAKACGVESPIFFRVPQGPAIGFLRLLPGSFTKRFISAEQIQRMAENKDFSIEDARTDLDYTPRPYAEAIRLKASGQAEVSD
jgi:nucleoside-diphosphate-sugar epimerase